MKIMDIEGIGSAYATKLSNAGIRTTETLLKKGAGADDRKTLEAVTGISHDLLLEWVNLADLYRIKGIGSEYSDLLEEAGVDTVVELSKRVADNLYAKIIEVNNTKNLVNRAPGINQVKGWIEQAKKLPRVVSY
jgi:predicted flap endonuclease-1-like 5' DNA nuclease